MYKCGIMGGTFDPIHFGHLVIAEAARHEFALDAVYFVPSGHPPHKEEVTDGEQRFMMTLLATATNDKFFTSRVEIDRPGYSYTYDTVQAFKQKFSQCEVYFITGADVISQLHQWHRYQELLSSCRFVVATRPGFSLSEDGALTKQEMEHIHILEVPSLKISSTDIRRRVRCGEPIKYLVPSTVEDYIYKYGLYRSVTSV